MVQSGSINNVGASEGDLLGVSEENLLGIREGNSLGFSVGVRVGDRVLPRHDYHQ